MGSWDVTCSLTGVHIGVGDKAVIVPLRLKEDVYDNELDHMRLFGNTNILSNDGVNVYFEEATYPIFGTYADYGDIENIVKDDNTKILEEYFGLTIEQIVTVLTDNRKDEIFYQPDMASASKILDMANPKHAELATYSITWIHGDVFSKLARSKNSQGGWRDHIDLGEPAFLESLGFTYVETKKDKERYNQKFKKDKLTLWSDGTWLEGNVYSFKELEKLGKKNGVEIDTSVAANKTYYEQFYDYKLRNYLAEKIKFHETEKQYYDTYSKDSTLTEEQKEVIRELYFDKKFTMFDSMSDRCSWALLHKDFRFKKAPNPEKLREHYKEHVRHKSFYRGETEEDIAAFHKSVEDRITALENAERVAPLSDAYGKAINEADGVLRSNITEWFTVKSFFHTLGRFLFPIGTSPQWGDTEALKNVLTAAMEVCDAELAEQREWEEENEDLLEEV